MKSKGMELIGRLIAYTFVTGILLFSIVFMLKGVGAFLKLFIGE